MPSTGSVTTDVGTSLLRLGGIIALVIGGVALVLLLARWLTGDLQRQRSARQRRREREAAEAARPPRVDGPETARRRAAGHHPVGRRVAATPTDPGTTPAARPRRPLEQVATDLRRLTRELAMVPGGMPMARRRGLLAAYDDVLLEAAELLEVPHQLTAVPPAARELERMRLLAALEAAGLVVER